MRVRLSFLTIALIALSAPAWAQNLDRKVVAQNTGGNGGITVVGRSSQNAAADTLAFSVALQLPAGADPIATVNPIVDALKNDGVADASWNASSFSLRYPGQVQVSGSIPVTRAGDYTRLIKDANAVAGTASAQNIGVYLQLRDCSALLESLGKKAIDDAHRQALIVAADLGVTLGAPVNVTGNPPLTDGCPQRLGGPITAFGTLGTGPWNPSGTVTFDQAVTITYAIRK